MAVRAWGKSGYKWAGIFADVARLQVGNPPSSVREQFFKPPAVRSVDAVRRPLAIQRLTPAPAFEPAYSPVHLSPATSACVPCGKIRVPLHQTARAGGEYEDFLTGFVLDDGNVWGRPVGVAVAQDGSLLVTDDGSNSIWRISYTGK